MTNTFKAKTRSLVVVGGLLLLMGLAFTSVVQAATAAATPLNSGEIAWLQFMREEEKLARDVYLKLYERWSLPIFYNIAQSEQTHMDAIKKLLDKYSISDPAAGKDIGQFTNHDLGDLYLTLSEQGESSETAALNAGVSIEKKDIADLGAALVATRDSLKDIQKVYQNLLLGSANHLAAFESELAK